jgi:hypothetical protein
MSRDDCLLLPQEPKRPVAPPAGLLSLGSIAVGPVVRGCCSGLTCGASSGFLCRPRSTACVRAGAAAPSLDVRRLACPLIHGACRLPPEMCPRQHHSIPVPSSFCWALIMMPGSGVDDRSPPAPPSAHPISHAHSACGPLTTNHAPIAMAERLCPGYAGSHGAGGELPSCLRLLPIPIYCEDA